MSAPLRSRREITRVAILAAAAMLTVVGATLTGALPSTALLTGSAAVGPATISAGTLRLGLSNGASATSWTGAVSLVPGGVAYARLTVANTGNVALRYAATATSTTDPLPRLLVTNVAVLAPGTTSCNAASYAAGVVVSGTEPAFGSSATTKIIGDPGAGAQPGDRSLAGSAAEDLCLQLTFPRGTRLGYAGRGLTATTSFTFSAENAQ